MLVNSLAVAKRKKTLAVLNLWKGKKSGDTYKTSVKMEKSGNLIVLTVVTFFTTFNSYFSLPLFYNWQKDFINQWQWIKRQETSSNIWKSIETDSSDFREMAEKFPSKAEKHRDLCFEGTVFEINLFKLWHQR